MDNKGYKNITKIKIDLEFIENVNTENIISHAITHKS